MWNSYTNNVVYYIRRWSVTCNRIIYMSTGSRFRVLYTTIKVITMQIWFSSSLWKMRDPVTSFPRRYERCMIQSPRSNVTTLMANYSKNLLEVNKTTYSRRPYYNLYNFFSLTFLSQVRLWWFVIIILYILSKMLFSYNCCLEPME